MSWLGAKGWIQDWCRALVVVAPCVVSWAGCAEPETTRAPAPAKASSADTGPIFEDRAAALGVDFRHQSGATGRLYMPETTGSGVGLFDYDRDGDLDLYLVQGGSLEGPSRSGDRLYRNDSGPDGSWRFVDVTDSSLIEASEYGQGVAIGDVDNDGWEDIFLANFGNDQLWVNRGDGGFVRRDGEAGLIDSGWATSAVFLDFDRDDRLDLFVTRYLKYSLTSHKDCFFATGGADYCKPTSYSPMTDLLYRNLGAGRFAAMDEAAVSRAPSNGLGVITADLDQNGWMDLYVANDQMANFLWINREGKEFVEQALLAGVALNSEGMAEASMGVVAADLDNDSRQDLFMTHLDGETNTLFRGLGQGVFEDRTRGMGLASPSLLRTSFGVAAIDVDNDADLDLVTVSGAVHIDPAQARAGEPLPLKQRDQLFLNDGAEFTEASGAAGADFTEPAVGRGLASGDLDNDGDLDLVLNNAHGPARVLVNQKGSRSKWTGLRIERMPGLVAAEGTRVELRRVDGSRQTGWVQRGGGYLSSSDPRSHFGLGVSETPVSVTVWWPEGRTQRWHGLRPGRYHTLGRSQGGLR